jgi:xylulokinase
VSAVLLGIDLGTSAVKAAAYSAAGRLLAASSMPYPTRRDGHAVEQEPADWLAALGKALGPVLGATATSPGPPAALAVTGQMSGLLVLDQAGRPAYPFLPWSDARAAGEAAWLAEQVGPDNLYRLTGCRAAPGYPAAKLRWLQACHPGLWHPGYRVCGAREFLVQRLTGRFVTDPSCAGASQFYDLAGAWAAPVLQALGLAREQLPAVVQPWAMAGATGPEVPGGLPEGIPVAAGAGDGPCSSWGAGAQVSGDVVVSIGTSGVVRVLADRPLLHPFGATTCYPVGGGAYAGTGVTSAAGAALDWAAAALGFSGGVPALVAEAEMAPPGAGGTLFVPDLGGARTPHWAPGARGAFHGLDLAHTRAHLARAVVEGVALSLALALEALVEAGAGPTRLIVTGGGGRSRLLAATMGGVTGLPVCWAREGDATLGAAMLAAVAAGLHPSLADARQAMAPSLEPVEPVALPADLFQRYCMLAKPVAVSGV